jgi:NIMA (never in mitosis gene a)-related kinase
MEYADAGDLIQKIFEHKRNGTQFAEDYIWDIFIQILKGLDALHQLKITHRDIKSSNIFLTTNGMAKLGDFNVSIVLGKGVMCETQTGTPYYASP